MDRSGQMRGARALARRLSVDIAIFAAMGLLLGFLAPFDSEATDIGVRYLYWIICIVGGGLIGVGADEGLRRHIASQWLRTFTASLVMTPMVTLLVLVTQHFLMRQPLVLPAFLGLLWQVWPIMLAVLAVRGLVWRRPDIIVETRTVIAPPLPEAEAAFRLRLSAKRRIARLIAIEAHDHYLKVHTDAGSELIALRFKEAMAELSMAHGWRVHRSWWLAADAVERVQWRRGVGEARLVGGLTAPVSRTYSPILKEAGWL